MSGGKRGNTRQYTPEVEAEMRRLWETSTESPMMICDRINALFGTELRSDVLGWKAKREGWRRHACLARSTEHRSALEERLLTRSLARWGAGKRLDNPVRPVPPGAFKVPPGGFRFGGGAP